jgi:hypothetical protein
MKSDKEFVSALNKSTNTVSVIANFLFAQGLQVLIKPTIVRSNFEDRHNFIDDGDLEIRQRIEVKHRNIEFTNANDYPFSSVIVDEQFKIDRIPASHLWAYIVVNNSISHICLIKSGTRKHWETQKMYDKKEQEQRNFYVCPKELCFFMKI